MQSFTSVDPLAEKYPNVSSYVYCMNNPVIYVDPDGRQYVLHSVARIVAENGSISIKLNNLHNVTRNAISDANNNPQNWKLNQIGIDLTIAKVKWASFDKKQDVDYTSYGDDYGEKNPDQAYNSSIKTNKGREISTSNVSSPGVVSGARGMLVLDVVVAGLELATSWSVYDDYNKINEQKLLLKNAVSDVNKGLIRGLIPKRYQNKKDMLSILNVVFQGENPTKNKEILTIGIRILTKVSKNYDPNKIKK